MNRRSGGQLGPQLMAALHTNLVLKEYGDVCDLGSSNPENFIREKVVPHQHKARLLGKLSFDTYYVILYTSM